MLLNSSKGLAQANNNDYPSTGDWSKADTTVATVPIYMIKNANAKMIERLYLFNVIKQQDSIIVLKNEYIKEQQNIIKDFQNKVDEANRVNENIINEIELQKYNNRIITYGLCTTAIGLLIGLIFK